MLAADARAAKYVNSPETLTLERRVFYGLDKTKRAILEARAAVLCEGQLDLIAFALYGGSINVVAPQGTAFAGRSAAAFAETLC
ncbi:MAG: hypothetical protein MZW92_74205 [Comamonadaceae bacterium]|nr:hypothetical protein [Comamonadaceae bacterium]